MTVDRLDEVKKALLRLQEDYDTALVASFRRAEAHMALADVEDEDDDAIDCAYEERFHCEVCVVRNVLEEVFPVVVGYIRALELALGLATREDLAAAAEGAPELGLDRFSWTGLDRRQPRGMLARWFTRKQ